MRLFFGAILAFAGVMTVGSTSLATDCWTLQGQSEVQDLIPAVMCFETMKLERATFDRRESFLVEGDAFKGSLAVTRKEDIGNRIAYVAEGEFITVDYGTCSTSLKSHMSLKFLVDKETGHMHFAVQGMLVDYVYNSDPCHLSDREGSLVYLHRRMD